MSKQNIQSVKVFSPATVANVACGFDVIGLALDGPGDEMELRISDTPGVKITAIEGANLPLEAAQNVAGVALMAMLQEYGQPDLGIEVSIKKISSPAVALGPAQPARQVL